MTCAPSPWPSIVKTLPWAFMTRNRKSAIFRFLHFQWLTAIENGDASLHRGGCRLLRHPPEKEVKAQLKASIPWAMYPFTFST